MNNNISSKVLTIGSEFNPPRGGIEMVLESYSKNIPDFQFVSSWKNLSKLKLILFFTRKLFTIIKSLSGNRRIQIIHMHGSYGGSVIRKFIILKIVKGIFRKKVIYHSHGSQFADYYKMGNSFERYIIKTLVLDSDAIICLSKSWKEYFEKTFGISNVYVLNNIVPEPKLVPGLTNNQNTVCKFLFLGLIGERKGVFDLVQTVRDNFHEFEGEVEIHVGGNGNVETFKNMLNNFNLSHIIKFHGWVDGNKKVELLNSCDVFILPSYNEGLPIAILEAMSYGLPVISSKVGGIPEIVEDGENGFLIEPGNLAEISNAISFFRDNPKSIKSFGENSARSVKKFFPKYVISDLNDIYKGLIS